MIYYYVSINSYGISGNWHWQRVWHDIKVNFALLVLVEIKLKIDFGTFIIVFNWQPFVVVVVVRVVKCASRRGHIINLGHGVLVGTPEEAVAHFFEVARSLKYDTLYQDQAVDSKLVVWEYSLSTSMHA